MVLFQDYPRQLIGWKPPYESDYISNITDGHVNATKSNPENPLPSDNNKQISSKELCRPGRLKKAMIKRHEY